MNTGATEKVELERLLRQVAVAKEELAGLELQKLETGDLAGRTANLTKEKERLQKEIADLRFAREVVHGEVETIESEKKAISKARTLAKKELGEMREAQQSVLNAGNRYRERMRSTQTLLYSMERSLAGMKGSLTRMKTEIAKEELLAASAKNLREAMERELEEVKTALKEARANTAKEKAVFQGVGETISEAKRKIIALNQETANINQRNKELREQKLDDFSLQEGRIAQERQELATEWEKFHIQERALGNKVLYLKKVKSELELASGKPLEVVI